MSDRDDPDPDCFPPNCSPEIYVMNVDGSAQTRITNNLVVDLMPTWTPDGTRITFTRITVCAPDGCDNALRNANADGSGETFQGDAGPGQPSAPAWAPNGLRLIDTSRDFGSSGGWLYTGNPNGTGDTLFCCSLGGDDPAPSNADWSPDGSRVAFSHQGLSMKNADGTGFVTLVSAAGDPSWSPDGTRIAFGHDGPEGIGIYTMDADGSDVTFLRPGGSPAWQPIPINGYPRPKAASPTEIALVPAYEPCTSANRTHGPPLAFGSCAPPVRTPPSDEADIRLTGTINDVRLASDLSDYTGSVEARVSVRITDKDNTPHPGGPGAATVQDITYSFPIPCVATADTTIGGECAFDTTAEAFMPGVAKEGRRAIWELGQLRIHDGDGNVFMRQGIFAP